MRLTEQQRVKVVENMGLVGKVINDRVHVYGSGVDSYNDLFQTGCIGLCKAAATDKGGCFSTYAYRLIWNEICTTLRKTAALRAHEYAMGEMRPETQDSGPDPELRIALVDMLRKVRREANPTVRKGIDGMELLAAGYTCREIGEREHTAANVVSARVSQARKYLMGICDVQDLCAERRGA